MSSTLFLMFDSHTWFDTAFIPGAVFGPAKFLSPNTHRELFDVPDIALYASALNHVFDL